MGKVIASLLLLASLSFAQYFPPLGGGSSSGSVTVNGTTCTLGSSCTVTGAPSGAAGGVLSGTYPNPGFADNPIFVGAVVAGSSAAVNGTLISEFTAVSTSSSTPRGITAAQFNTGSESARLNGYKARGTQASPTIVVTADLLTRWSGFGYDGANFLESASVVFGTTGTIAATRVPSYVAFSTSTDATPSVMTEAARFTPKQNFIIGGATEGNYKIDVQKSGSIGTARFFDQTAATGATLVTITKGASQTGVAKVLQSDASAEFVNVTGTTALNSGGPTHVGTYLDFASASLVRGSTDGVIKLSNNGETDFSRLQFGGTTSSFGGIARDGAALRIVTADSNTAYADLSMRHSLAGGTAPALGGACSTAASGTLTDESGRITTTTTGTCTFTITFGTAYTTDAPSCSVFNETTANLARPSATTAVLTGVVTTISGDVLVYQCKGHKV